ncbi:MAG TPA: PLD nuclease N-terminal domain-containing protein [Dermatophilaceae bacterium]|nr:PLD nuclease N-terminal domain-containing protein [Dermatophilaceae bacterium]
MARFLPFVIGLALTIYALVDAIQTDDLVVLHLRKIYWILLILLFPWVGAIAWLVAGKQRGQLNGRNESRYPRPPLGPDDDPDFLRGL